MRYIVSCRCVDHLIAECRNQSDAEQVARRHHILTGHDATAERVLDTPLEGLL